MSMIKSTGCHESRLRSFEETGGVDEIRPQIRAGKAYLPFVVWARTGGTTYHDISAKTRFCEYRDMIEIRRILTSLRIQDT